MPAASISDASRRCVCPGSYDPVTNGHLDVIARAATLFDQVIVAVVHNPSKTGTFPVSERIEFLRDALPSELFSTGRVRIDDVAGGLLVDYCQEVGANSVVKGVRGSADYAYELPMARMNRQLSGLETVFLPAAPEVEHISSSLIREVVAHGGDVTGMVPEHVRERLEAVLRR